jgi:hypothetical protein
MRAGQLSIAGERMPPSSTEPLRPFMPPFQRQLFGPLSEKYSTMVFSRSPSSSRRRSTRPTLSSWFSSMARAQRVWLGISWSASAARWLRLRPLKRSQYFSGTDHGEWGVVNGT